MEFLWVLIVILSIAFVVVVAATIAATKRVVKTNKMQQAADLSFKKMNGTHNFKYAIKKFSDANGKRIKIIIVGETNMSDVANAWNTATVSSANSGRVTLKGTESGRESVSEFNNLTNLQPTLTVPVPAELEGEKLHVRVETEWTFSGLPLKEELEFDLD